MCIRDSCAVLYLIGLFGDSYYAIAERVPFVRNFYDALFSVFDYTKMCIRDRLRDYIQDSGFEKKDEGKKRYHADWKDVRDEISCQEITK